MLDEKVIEVVHAKEAFKGFDGFLGVLGHWEIKDGFDLAWEGFNAIFADSVTQEVNLRDIKQALFSLDHQSVILESVEEGVEILLEVRSVFALHHPETQIRNPDLAKLEMSLESLGNIF